MDNSKYLFFNKEGYPHNFQYNNNSESWEGKIIFDENSDQTFKTQSLHLFEEVEPIKYTLNSDLVSINYNNNSGLTIIGETDYNGEIITNIEKVNNSSNFYSKWIYGENFHKKFPIGTIINFSGITGTGTSGLTDFSNNQYFTVLTNKKHAFLIITNTDNSAYDFVFISGTTSSLNMISINDYNRVLSGDTFFNNIYTDKVLSIINSNSNDGVFSIIQTGITQSYINEIKIDYIKDRYFTLKIDLFTERPKLFQGDVKITDFELSSLTGYLNINNKYINFLEPIITYTIGGESLIKKNIIFEDIYGDVMFDGFTFTVDSGLTNENIGDKQINFQKYSDQSNSQWNTLQFSGSTTLQVGDIIEISGITGTKLMHNRNFYINNIIYNSDTDLYILFTKDYIINESGSTYNITKKLQSHQITKLKITSSGDITSFNNVQYSNIYCYSTENTINYSQIYISGSTENTAEYNTINRFINKFRNIIYQYGIDIYHTTKNNSGSTEDYLTVEGLYGTNTKYFTASGYTNNVKISDDFSLSLSGFTDKYNIITDTKLYDEYTNRISDSLYKKNVPTEIVFYLNNDNDRFGFKMLLNGNEYYTNFTSDTQTTIDNFIEIYQDTFNNNGFIINSGYSATYTGYTVNLISDVDIWELEIVVNILSSYYISNLVRNSAILLSGNEIQNNISSINFFNIGLTTGMIIKISGSTYNTNNKEYNIIGLTENNMTLSYEGVFFSENNIEINGQTRVYIRKPRSDYNKDIYIKVYWEEPISDETDESIFLYDITGDQLLPYNNNSDYTYNGIKPLIDPLLENTVFLNDTPNKDTLKINNPKYQQTIFDELIFKLDSVDSSTSNWIPEPIEIYTGYNSKNEGVNSRLLKIDMIEKKENVDDYFSFTGYTNSGSSISVNNFIFYDTTIEYITSDFNFLEYGFKKDQLIKCEFKDQNTNNQRIFENTNTYKILNVNRRKIIIDSGYTYKSNTFDTDIIISSGFTNFITTGTTFFYKIEVQPREILYCPIYGQTEVEDIRYKVNLNNLGIQSEDDVYKILYQSDIEDDAIDYILFNRKRKEMLTTFREIYDYIGSYKSLINAINYFGYNNLQLNEYYKNIDSSSPFFDKTHKVLIPDIFDNSVEGWNEMDFIAGKYQNDLKWKKTNLFNLSYDITDNDGNNVLIYTLDEIQYKLTKMKKWLRQNIIPVSANLLDITGVADTNNTLYQDYDESNQTIKSVVERKTTVVNFNYTATLNFQTNYLITVNFYILSGTTNINNFLSDTTGDSEIPNSFSAKIKTFYLSGCTNSDILIPVQYFKINKNDLKPFTFTLNKDVDPYIYIETTTYDNDGNGLGFVNNKLFYYDEPRNYWLVNNNFNLTEMKYWQTSNFISNEPQKWVFEDIVNQSSVYSIETNTKVNTLNNTYLSKINTKNN